MDMKSLLELKMEVDVQVKQIQTARNIVHDKELFRSESLFNS